MKLTFIFTDTPDLKALSKYDIYRTRFEFPDEILDLPDCEDRLLTIAQQVGQLTQACLHVSCKDIGWKNKVIKTTNTAKVGIVHTYETTMLYFRKLHSPRNKIREIRILAPVKPPFRWFARKLKGDYRDISFLLVNSRNKASGGEGVVRYVQQVDFIGNQSLSLLNINEDVFKWAYEGFHPRWDDKKLARLHKSRLKARNRDFRKQQRAVKKRTIKARKQKSKVGQVYFIQQGETGPIKIGYSTNPQKRLQSLNTANPYPLRLLTTIIGDESVEQALHEQFAAHRLDGEWFEPAPDLLVYIASLS